MTQNDITPESADASSVDAAFFDAPSVDAPSVDAASVDVASAEQSPIESDPAAGDVADDGRTRSPGSTEDEGEIAADYIEELLDISDLDGDIEIESTDERLTIVVGEAGDTHLQHLATPDVVAALQDLTRIAVQVRSGEFSHLVLDIAGSREARAKELGALVDDAVEAIDGGAESHALPPMSSYERKLVHDIVRERGYASESQGEGRDRRTVVLPA